MDLRMKDIILLSWEKLSEFCSSDLNTRAALEILDFSPSIRQAVRYTGMPEPKAKKVDRTILL
jgi:hypothetical protein